MVEASADPGFVLITGARSGIGRATALHLDQLGYRVVATDLPGTDADGLAREGFEDKIVIYRDTLERDFGHDRALLARQVEQTLRHELAHHLGWNESGVDGLGL